VRCAKDGPAMIRAFGVVIPAHNEEILIANCLKALKYAAKQGGVPPVRMVVVVDSCTDATAEVADQYDVEVMEVQLQSAGGARAEGFEYIVASLDVDLEDLWLCTTDADSIVPEHWFLHQMRREAEGYDAVVGTVVVEDWSEHSNQTRRRYAKRYEARDGHPHVHGANLGLSAIALKAIGGFPPLSLAEDHALVAGLMKMDFQICRSAMAPVTTSARRDWRAPDGFGALLNSMDEPAWRRVLRLHS
ncbi:MAG: glycosyltransferase, partial [Acidimicrobiales bacterium]